MYNSCNIIEHVIDTWEKLQAQAPLVQCITNSVAANYAANILLAAGASPAMIDNPFEAESFTQISGALSINTGTPTTEQMQAMMISAQTAHKHHIPWVLDPVGYGPILKWRSDAVDALLQYHPSVIRGNASEISALAGRLTQSKGVDSTLKSDEMFHHAQHLLTKTSCVAISGETDYILSNAMTCIVKIQGGSHLQPRITATGCALGALVTAYCAVAPVHLAAITAHVHFAIAGKLAFDQAQTVGSFNIMFMDYIHMLDANLIEQYARIELISDD